MNKMVDYINTLSNRVCAPYATRFFTLLIYVWFVAEAITLWPYMSLMWGDESVFLHSPRQSNLLNNFFFQLVYEPTRFKAIYWLHLLASIVSLFEYKWSFVSRIVVWATCLILYFAAPQGFNSGILFMSLMAFYAVFVYTKPAKPLRILLTNLSRLAMVIQVVLIYFISSIFKLSGAHWVKGEAVYYALNIDVYSSPFWQSISKYTSLWMAVTYFALAYQLLFPVLLIFKKQRSWLLLIGVFFHVMIGVVMNLWDFALAMIFCYALFMKENHAKFLMPFRTLRKNV